MEVGAKSPSEISPPELRPTWQPEHYVDHPDVHSKENPKDESNAEENFLEEDIPQIVLTAENDQVDSSPTENIDAPTSNATRLPTQAPTAKESATPTTPPQPTKTPTSQPTPAPTTSTPSNFDSATLSRINAIVEKVRSSTGLPAISIAIAKNEKLVFKKAYGMADKSTNTPATTSSRFRIASVSKPITAIAIMKLVEANKLSLDAKVFGQGGILGDAYGTRRPYRTHVTSITIRHLLHHTSGGWSNNGNDPMFSNPQMSATQLITHVIDNVPLSYAPGVRYAYSNFGYSILGRIIEKVSGQSYETFVKNAVLAPSGISEMSIGGDTRSQRQPNEVVYYDTSTEAPYSMKVRRMDAHGGWLASAEDLVKFGVRVDQYGSVPDLLSSASLKKVTTGSSANSNYGLGFAVNTAYNYWHNGSIPGTSSILVRTSSGLVWAAVANTRNGNIDLDGMMWNIVNTVSTWPNVNLF